MSYRSLINHMDRQDKRDRKFVHLIQVGDVQGIFASELQPGMRIMYNYGSTGDVETVEQKGNFVHYQVREKGTLYDAKKKSSSLIAAYWPKA